jgi:prephenate dehydrogenase
MTVAIVGAGLIGTSVALAVRRGDADARVVMLDRGDSLDALAAASLVVLATPVDVILELLRSQTARLRGRVVTDVGSTKRAIVAAARQAGLVDFVGGHPMAGVATTGPAAARADLFDDRPWFLVPHGATQETVQRVHAFVRGLGARVVTVDDDGATHDRVMAAVSHAPQVAASVLMNVIGEAVGPNGLQWAGQGCRDTTRLAASSASVWRGILSTNAVEVQPLLLELADQLRGIAETLDDRSAVERLFAAANRHRRSIGDS